MPRAGSKKYVNTSLQYTSWIFTLNNYTFDEQIFMQEQTFPSPDRKVASIAWSEEIGASGTPHLQGFMQFYKKSMYFWSLHLCS